MLVFITIHTAVGFRAAIGAGWAKVIRFIAIDTLMVCRVTHLAIPAIRIRQAFNTYIDFLAFKKTDRFGSICTIIIGCTLYTGIGMNTCRCTGRMADIFCTLLRGIAFNADAVNRADERGRTGVLIIAGNTHIGIFSLGFADLSIAARMGFIAFAADFVDTDTGIAFVTAFTAQNFNTFAVRSVAERFVIKSGLALIVFFAFPAFMAFSITDGFGFVGNTLFFVSRLIAFIA